METKMKPWVASMDNRTFNEDALKYEVARIWGEHGAHSEVLAMMRKRSDAYRRLVKLLKQYLDPECFHDQTQVETEALLHELREL